MAGELKENPKEVAEHIMLVDLARNDVGRVAKFGTVHVDELMTLERYSHVMHLTSQVSGELVDGKTPIDVLRATLPAGTVSGAPKVRAMEIIDALEPVKRGPYAGVVGYVDFSGNLDTAIAIRTMFVGAARRLVPGRRRHRRRLDSRRRRPRVPQQGRRAAGRGPRRAPDDRPTHRRQHPRLTMPAMRDEPPGAAHLSSRRSGLAGGPLDEGVGDGVGRDGQQQDVAGGQHHVAVRHEGLAVAHDERDAGSVGQLVIAKWECRQRVTAR